MGRAQTAPQLSGIIQSIEHAVSSTNKNYVKVRVSGQNAELMAFNRDYEALKSQPVGAAIRFNVGFNDKNEAKFLNDVECGTSQTPAHMVTPSSNGQGAASTPHPTSFPPSDRDLSIVAQVCIKEASNLHQLEMQHGDSQKFDPIRLVEIAVDVANAYNAALIALKK